MKNLDKLIESIENPDMYEFTLKLTNRITSNGLYDFTCSEDGLIKRAYTIMRILNYIFDVDFYDNFTSRDRDTLRIAALISSIRMYSADPVTQFEYPLIMAETIRSFFGSGLIPDKEIEQIADLVESYIGCSHLDDTEDVSFPKHATKIQNMLYIANYLATRKDINIEINYD